MKSKYNKGILAMMFLVVLLLAGCQSQAEEVTQALKPQLTVVETMSVINDDVQAFYSSFGEISPQNQVDLFLSGTGEVDSILVKAGDVVSMDTPLIKLSTDQVKTTYNAQESQLRTIRDNFKIQLNALRDNFLKQSELLENGFATQSSVDTLKTQMETLEMQYDDARNNYNNQVQNLKKAVDDRLLTSTIEGEIAGIYVKKGQKISNQKAISIVNRDILYVKTMVTSSTLQELSIGTRAIITFSNDQRDVIEGVVTNMELIPDPVNKLYKVEVELKNKTDSVFIGDYVEVKFITDEYKATLAPNTAIIYEGSKTFVFLLEANSAVKVPVELGLTKGEYVEIKSDKELLDKQIIVKGQSYIKDGEVVELKN
ncbi:efflux RND transporter periplasmic adaptor subunit [Fusibacter sp. 3D3]|uniref:efflux RND transporter periplasmic adaptor subunit n=1 Tax=Fusibacter sp. 3D3 TaxID=1048380 RepID=UPI0008532CEB|nr:efflux RND transporter periplasmic adaptor subunit [Fusibacter sp. 3D3]GAU77241.1 probable Co/Zn/Cd efflux system membrane fusion protein [Fusibacter sp. 3D3]